MIRSSLESKSVRWFWWYFHQNRISISIWKFDRKMRKISIVEKVNFTWFCKGNSFRKIKKKPTFGKLKFSPFSIEFFHLTIKFSYGFQNSIISKIPPKSPRWQSVEYTYNFFLTFVEFRYEFQQSVKMYRVTVKNQSFMYIVRQSYL